MQNEEEILKKDRRRGTSGEKIVSGETDKKEIRGKRLTLSFFVGKKLCLIGVLQKRSELKSEIHYVNYWVVKKSFKYIKL